MNRVNKRHCLLIGLAILFSCVYLTWRIGFTMPFEHGAASSFWGVVLLIVELFGAVELIVHLWTLSNLWEPACPEVDSSQFPPVDVFLATFNEPVELLYKTLTGALAMEYPNDVHIYLCDDGNRPQVRALALEMGVNYLARSEHTHAKAGNLNHALAHSSSPLIVTLDADMIPLPGLLLACAPYFLTGERVGFVQTPQSFYNHDLFQYHLYCEDRVPNEQDYFYRVVQLGRNRHNAVLYGGSNTMLSRMALEEIGGFYTGAITEDLATGILIQKRGYRCYALSEVHAHGLAPTDLGSLYRQRERWGRGCIATVRKLGVLTCGDLSLAQKVAYLSCASYWYSGLRRAIYFLAPILCALFDLVLVNCTLPALLLTWLPAQILCAVAVRSASGGVRSGHWANLYDSILSLPLLPSILLETLGFEKREFSVTHKERRTDSIRYRLKLAAPSLLLTLCTVLSLFRLTMRVGADGAEQHLVVLLWLWVNLYYLTTSLLFFQGRPSQRSTQRFTTQIPCRLLQDGRVLRGVTCDLCEGGALICLEGEVAPESVGKLYLDLDGICCCTSVRVVRSSSERNTCALSFTEFEEGEFAKLLGILYHRAPEKPQKMVGYTGSLWVIWGNLCGRLRGLRSRGGSCREPSQENISVGADS